MQLGWHRAFDATLRVMAGNCHRSYGDVDFAADLIELFLGRNVLGLRLRDHHLHLLIEAERVGLVNGDVFAHLDVTGWNVARNSISICCIDRMGCSILKPAISTASEVGILSSGSTSMLVRIINCIESGDECGLIALQPFAETDEALNAVAGVSFGCH